MRAAWLLVLLALVSACGGGGSSNRVDGTLSDLKSVDELRARFNEDRGDPRLILVLSPT